MCRPQGGPVREGVSHAVAGAAGPTPCSQPSPAWEWTCAAPHAVDP